MELNIGSEEIHGEHIGENLDFSELECINTIWLLSKTALGEPFNLKLNGSTLSNNLKLLKCENAMIYSYL